MQLERCTCCFCFCNGKAGEIRQRESFLMPCKQVQKRINTQENHNQENANPQQVFEYGPFYSLFLRHVLETIFVRYGKFFTSASAAGGQNAASVCGSHTLTKTMFVTAFTNGGLKCPFHIVYLH